MVSVDRTFYSFKEKDFPVLPKRTFDPFFVSHPMPKRVKQVTNTKPQCDHMTDLEINRFILHCIEDTFERMSTMEPMMDMQRPQLPVTSQVPIVPSPVQKKKRKRNRKKRNDYFPDWEVKEDVFISGPNSHLPKPRGRKV